MLEVYNKEINKNKSIIRDKVSKDEMNELMFSIIKDLNIKFKNEESKQIAKDYSLFAIKLSNINETRLRERFNTEIQQRLTEEVPNNLLDTFIFRYNASNINYLKLIY